MKKVYLDTEFHEYHKQPKVLGFDIGNPIPTIDLISIGMVDENNKEYYAVCNEFNVDAAWANGWLRDNVLVGIHLELSSVDGRTGYDAIADFKRLLKKHGKSKAQIAKEVIEFCDVEPEFYAYYADYDWVVFCQMWSALYPIQPESFETGMSYMNPKGFPYYCKDLKQMLDEIGNPDHSKYIAQDNEHNALADAKFNRKLHGLIKGIKFNAEVADIMNEYADDPEDMYASWINWERSPYKKRLNTFDELYRYDASDEDAEDIDPEGILGTAEKMERVVKGHYHVHENSWELTDKGECIKVDTDEEGTPPEQKFSQTVNQPRIHMDVSDEPSVEYKWENPPEVEEFIKSQTYIPTEAVKVVDDNFWDLTERPTQYDRSIYGCGVDVADPSKIIVVENAFISDKAEPVETSSSSDNYSSSSSDYSSDSSSSSDD